MALSHVLLTTALVLFAAAACAGLIAALRPLLQRYALAMPNARSSHVQPTPQGGGIAVLAAAIGTVILGVWLWPGGDGFSIQSLIRLALAAILMGVVGTIDDVRGLSVAPRIISQFVAAAIALSTLADETRFVSWLPWWIERGLLLVGFVWLVNLVNFMDGIDWITAAEVVPIAGALTLFGLGRALPATETVVALALLGAMLGFAPFNRPKAVLFLGDVGSLSIGLVLGWLLLNLAARGHVVAAILLPLYYLADATITLVRRLVAREAVWQAHRSHFYQLATKRGLSVSEIVACIFVTNIALGILAAISVFRDGAIVNAAMLIVGALVVGALLYRLWKGKP